MAVCKPRVVLQWIGCDAELIEACGWISGETAIMEDDSCAKRSTKFASRKWDSDNVPGPGDTVMLDGISWYVRQTNYSPPCTIVLSLCLPILSCPDCLATIYKEESTPGECGPSEDLVPIQTDVPVRITRRESETVLENDAVVSRAEYLICAGTAISLDPGQVIACGTNYYRVISVRKKAGMSCLPESIAVPISCPME